MTVPVNVPNRSRRLLSQARRLESASTVFNPRGIETSRDGFMPSVCVLRRVRDRCKFLYDMCYEVVLGHNSESSLPDTDTWFRFN
jgi:hypothetical protein